MTILLNGATAFFAALAALLWLRSAMARVAHNPKSRDFQIIENGMDVLETIKLQSKWNKWAAMAATAAAAFQAAAAAVPALDGLSK